MGAAARVALVTGGARGIGRAICLALAAQGTGVAVCDLNVGGAEAVALEAVELGVRAISVEADVSHRASVRAMVRTTVERLGRLDILVNNAGISSVTPFEEIDDEEWQRVLGVNLTGVFLCIQEAIKEMVRHEWGRVITISSVAGKIGGLKAAPHYSAAKGGVIPLTLCVARQYAHHGVTANVVAPGQIETDMIREWPEEAKQSFVDAIPVGRLGQPEEVAAAVAFLASEAAGFINGEILDVNGGFLMD